MRHRPDPARSRRLATLGAAVALLLVLAGCSETNVEPVVESTEATEGLATMQTEAAVAATPAAVADADRWADQVCTAAVRWQDEANTAVAELPEELTGATSLQDATNTVGDGLREVAQASTAAANEIGQAELPDTQNRDELRAELDRIAVAMNAVAGAAEDVVAVDQNLVEFVSSAQEAFATVEQSLASITESWQRIGQLNLGEETELALRTNPDCLALQQPE